MNVCRKNGVSLPLVGIFLNHKCTKIVLCFLQSITLVKFFFFLLLYYDIWQQMSKVPTSSVMIIALGVREQKIYWFKIGKYLPSPIFFIYFSQLLIFAFQFFPASYFRLTLPFDPFLILHIILLPFHSFLSPFVALSLPVHKSQCLCGNETQGVKSQPAEPFFSSLSLWNCLTFAFLQAQTAREKGWGSEDKKLI